MMPVIVGTEWIIDAFGCEAESLRQTDKLRAVFSRLVSDLGLKTIGDGNWHQFPEEQGVTGLVMLTESHLACHTYPEHRTATFNLYCCRERPEWDWAENLKELLGAEKVKVTKIIRGSSAAARSAGVSPAVAGASRFRSGMSEIEHDHDRSATVASADGAVQEASRLRSGMPKISFGEVKIRERGHLPHWEKENGIYFVTYRLADSLPKDVLESIKLEREAASKVLENLSRELSNLEEKKIDALFSERIEEYLDNGYGSCILKDRKIAELTTNSIKYFDGQRYDILAWCVMPNHVHVVLRPKNRHKLEDIIHSWKSFTAHEINKITGGEGEVWQREYYDHLIRDQEELERIISYVLNNPIKANLSNWSWVGGRKVGMEAA
jgi:S-adenosylmethionine decarboxylase proenzyme